MVWPGSEPAVTRFTVPNCKMSELFCTAVSRLRFSVSRSATSAAILWLFYWLHSSSCVTLTCENSLFKGSYARAKFQLSLEEKSFNFGFHWSAVSALSPNTAGSLQMSKIVLSAAPHQSFHCSVTLSLWSVFTPHANFLSVRVFRFSLSG